MATIAPSTGVNADHIGARSSSYTKSTQQKASAPVTAPRGLGRSRAVHRVKSSDQEAPRNFKYGRPSPVYTVPALSDCTDENEYTVPTGTERRGLGSYMVPTAAERCSLESVVYDEADQQSPEYGVVIPQRRGLGSVIYDEADPQSPEYGVVPPQRRDLGSVIYDEADPQSPEYEVVPPQRRGLGSVAYATADPQSPAYCAVDDALYSPGLHDEIKTLERNRNRIMGRNDRPNQRRRASTLRGPRQNPEGIYGLPPDITGGYEYSECQPITPVVATRSSQSREYDNVPDCVFPDYDHNDHHAGSPAHTSPTHQTVKIARVSMC